MEVKSKMTIEERGSLIRKLLGIFSLIPLFFILFIIFPAGTFNYWQFYAYCSVLLIPMFFVLIYFLKNDPRFLERRIKTREKEKEQKLVQLISLPVFIAGFVIPGFDKRFGWSHVPDEISIVADLIIFIGYFLIFLVFRQNSYASRIVEIDKDQKVISTGLYSIVRHPMYLGVLMMYLPTSLALGSYWGLIPFATMPAILVIRMLNEEKILKENLPGYKQYCLKTRYRLIPFIW